MNTMRLGRTDFFVSRLAFGALPIQRAPWEEAVPILRRAAEGGITFFDTARLYSDSEAKIGAAFEGIRENLFLASKTMGGTPEAIRADLAVTLDNLRTDYLDVYQFHNPSTVPLPGDGSGRYELFAELKRAGVIRAIGLTSHSLERARQAVDSGLYDTLQYPFSLLATGEEEDLVASCRAADVGFICMKALAGGLVRDIPAAFAFMGRFDNVLPIWGIQRMSELEEFLALEAAPPLWNEPMAEIARDYREALGKSFCRGCGYCQPCPQEIAVHTVARLFLTLRRSPWKPFAEPSWQKEMARVENCTQCGTCASRCPYHLDPPALIRRSLDDYVAFMRERGVDLTF
ncbi:MAG: aldo/keto reductase [Desulfovibrio sp.]|nr:aldo/keto reductase [Desulfovibrio sp.]